MERFGEVCWSSFSVANLNWRGSDLAWHETFYLQTTKACEIKRDFSSAFNGHPKSFENEKLIKIMRACGELSGSLALS
jgi:hypothetical protein